jgi:hypothetical protein
MTNSAGKTSQGSQTRDLVLAFAQIGDLNIAASIGVSFGNGLLADNSARRRADFTLIDCFNPHFRAPLNVASLDDLDDRGARNSRGHSAPLQSA